MSGIEIKCSYCQASFDEAEGACPYCGRSLSQIKKEKEDQKKVLSDLRKQFDEHLDNHGAAKAWEDASPILKRLDSRTERIENKQNTHRQENKTAFQRLEGKLDEYQKALLEGMKEILAQEEGIDASVKAYFEKAIPLCEKAGPDASEKVGEETIYASPAKHLEQMKEGDAAPFPAFFNCVAFELRSKMETALKRLGIPVIKKTGNVVNLARTGELDKQLEEEKLEDSKGDFRFPVVLFDDCRRDLQKAAYWRIKQNVIDLATGKITGSRLQKGLAGNPIDRFLCVLGNEEMANKLTAIWKSCNEYIHGSPLPNNQLSGETVETKRKELFNAISVINGSGLLADEKI